jgi:GMP synthase (glutamine-hydrolysing)
MKNILVLKAGQTSSPEVRASYGDYDAWFARVLAPLGHRLTVVPTWLGAPLPDPASFDALVMTGSPASVTQPAPWMDAAGRYLLEAAKRRIQVLGVCFGHQLLARACGGAVVRSPRGREMGTVRCTLTPEGRQDPLFEGVEAQFEVQTTHADEVDALPEGFELLATNAHSPVQAFRSGQFLRGVQFHPETDDATMAALVDSRAEELRQDAQSRGVDPEAYLERIRAAVRPTPTGARILENFVRLLA